MLKNKIKNNRSIKTITKKCLIVGVFSHKEVKYSVVKFKRVISSPKYLLFDSSQMKKSVNGRIFICATMIKNTSN